MKKKIMTVAIAMIALVTFGTSAQTNIIEKAKNSTENVVEKTGDAVKNAAREVKEVTENGVEKVRDGSKKLQKNSNAPIGNLIKPVKKSVRKPARQNAKSPIMAKHVATA